MPDFSETQPLQSNDIFKEIERTTMMVDNAKTKYSKRKQPTILPKGKPLKIYIQQFVRKPHVYERRITIVALIKDNSRVHQYKNDHIVTKFEKEHRVADSENEVPNHED